MGRTFLCSSGDLVSRATFGIASVRNLGEEIRVTRMCVTPEEGREQHVDLILEVVGSP